MFLSNAHRRHPCVRCPMAFWGRTFNGFLGPRSSFSYYENEDLGSSFLLAKRPAH